jgi:chloramphenicol 3-O phosphotransferase
MAPGRIIYLNGTSSAGKSSIAAALQEILAEPYLHLGIDTFLRMLPLRYRPGGPQGPSWALLPDGGVRPVPGELARRLRSGMYHAVAALVRAGNNVILDDVINGPDALQEAVELLGDFDVLFVGIHCPLAILEERERAREERRPGTARGMLAGAHAHGLYDLEIDTSVASPMKCASQIERHLREGPAPTVFRQLREMLIAND